MIRIEGSIEIPFYFRLRWCLNKDKAIKEIKRKLKREYPTSKIRWLRVIK